jgi:hypothetical protein
MVSVPRHLPPSAFTSNLPAVGSEVLKLSSGKYRRPFYLQRRCLLIVKWCMPNQPCLDTSPTLLSWQHFFQKKNFQTCFDVHVHVLWSLKNHVQNSLAFFHYQLLFGYCLRVIEDVTTLLFVTFSLSKETLHFPKILNNFHLLFKCHLNILV